MKRILFFLILDVICINADAAVKLSPIFSSHMVLQQQTTTGIWGTAGPGAAVTVTTSWNGASYTSTASNDGRWRVDVSTPSYGGPYTITVFSGKKEKIVLEDVLIGEVWLCGGQSNMDMKMSADVVGGLEDMKNAHNNPDIRILHIGCNRTYEEQYEPGLIGDGWNLCDFETLYDFSATAFYFGRKINAELGVPVGLIESCWGGSRIESWISSATGAGMPEIFGNKERVNLVYDHKGHWAEWNTKVCTLSEGNRCGWASRSYKDTDWATYTVPGILEEQLGCPEFNGMFWMRKTVDVPKSWAGKPVSMILDAIDDYDYAYVNGKCIAYGEGYTTNRHYTIPAGVLKPGKNVIALRVIDIEGDAGIYAETANNYLRLNDGNTISLNGEWKVKFDLRLEDTPAIPVPQNPGFTIPSLMYNAMIAPLVGYDIKGAIWYQGCANEGEADNYRILQPMLIHDWSCKWGRDLPFFITQLPNYNQSGDRVSLREAQAFSVKAFKNAGMACTIDIGDDDDNHPKDKVDVGERLAFQALHKTYGRDFAFCGPEYAGYSIEGNTIRINFDYCFDGLETGHRDNRKLVTNFYEEPVEGFLIAGPDKVFHKALAEIDGNTVIVRSDEVGCPVAVRYAWENNPVCNLYNGAGLPAAPFRTDSWNK